MKIQKEFIPPQNSDMEGVLNHFEVKPDMPFYTHRVRGGKYVVLATLEYADAEPAYEGDKMLICMTPHLFAGIWNGIIRANSPDRIPRKEQGSYFLFLGELQCRLPIMYGNKIVVYRNVEKEWNWYRPEHEFQDGRFPKLKDKT